MFLRIAVIFGFQFGVSISVSAAPLLEPIDVSNDVAWRAGATTVNDEDVRRVTLPSAVTTINLGALPTNVDVTAIDRLEDGRRIFALDTFVDLGNGLTAGPEDIVAWNGSNFAIFFDGSAAGVPAGTMIDAVAQVSTGDVTLTILSFDVPTALPGGLMADDEDLVAWSGTTWSLFFDGSANGIPATLDIDGFDQESHGGTWYFSFDTSGKIATVNFDDEDIVAFDGISWSLAYDASANLDPTFAAGDLDAFSIYSIQIFRDGFESVFTLQ